jgi:biopolymer transport protein ExbB
MNLVEWLKRVMVSTGAEWVMWVMIILSIASVAIILERAWFYNSVKDDLAKLSRDLQSALENSIEAAKRRMAQSPSAEAAVVTAGLSVAQFGPEAAEQAMDGAVAIQKMKLERRLAFLATLGNNAPFIGLFGTVIGVVMAFEALGQQSAEAANAAQLAPQKVMASIGEALVATAVGIAVAIPAVAANNLFQRMTRATLANTEALASLLIIHLRGNPALATGETSEEAYTPKDEPKRKTEKAEKTEKTEKTEKKTEKKKAASEEEG